MLSRYDGMLCEGVGVGLGLVRGLEVAGLGVGILVRGTGMPR